MGLSARGNAVRVAVAAWPWGAYLGEEAVRQGVRLKTSSFVRFHHNSIPPNAKASGRLYQLDSRRLRGPPTNYDEALLLDVNGYVAGGQRREFLYRPRR